MRDSAPLVVFSHPAMTEAASEPFRVRPYRPGDRQAIREICAATCWMGQYRPEMIPDDWVWAEYWTRYFTDIEPEHTWVVEESATGKVAGYLNGTTDERRFQAYVPRLMPGIVWHVIRRRLLRRPAARRAILSMVQSMLRNEFRLPPGVERAYPATLHLDLLPNARGSGMGLRLFKAFRARMEELGVPGIHVQPLSVNRIVKRFMGKAGFRLVASSPIRAFRHIEPGPVELQTWVLDLGLKAKS